MFLNMVNCDKFTFEGANLSGFWPSVTLQPGCAFWQFRLFFVWLTKSLRQLNGDVGPQANQLPAIDRFVHYALRFYKCVASCTCK